MWFKTSLWPHKFLESYTGVLLRTCATKTTEAVVRVDLHFSSQDAENYLRLVCEYKSLNAICTFHFSEVKIGDHSGKKSEPQHLKLSSLEYHVKNDIYGQTGCVFVRTI